MAGSSCQTLLTEVSADRTGEFVHELWSNFRQKLRSMLHGTFKCRKNKFAICADVVLDVGIARINLEY